MDVTGVNDLRSMRGIIRAVDGVKACRLRRALRGPVRLRLGLWDGFVGV